MDTLGVFSLQGLDVDTAVRSNGSPLVCGHRHIDRIRDRRVRRPESLVIPRDDSPRSSQYDSLAWTSVDPDGILHTIKDSQDAVAVFLKPLPVLKGPVQGHRAVPVPKELELDPVAGVGRLGNISREHFSRLPVTLHDLTAPQNSEMRIETDQFAASFEVRQRRDAGAVPSNRKPAVGSRVEGPVEPDEVVDSLGQLEPDDVLEWCPRAQPTASLAKCFQCGGNIPHRLLGCLPWFSRLDPEKSIFFSLPLVQKQDVGSRTDRMNLLDQSRSIVVSPSTPRSVRRLRCGDCSKASNRKNGREILWRVESPPISFRAVPGSNVSFRVEREPSSPSCAGHFHGVRDHGIGHEKSTIIGPTYHFPVTPKYDTRPCLSFDLDGICDFLDYRTHPSVFVVIPLAKVPVRRQADGSIVVEKQPEWVAAARARFPVDRDRVARFQNPLLVPAVENASIFQNPNVGVETDQFLALIEVRQRRDALRVRTYREPAIRTRVGQAIEADEIADALGVVEADHFFFARRPRAQSPTPLAERFQGRRHLQDGRIPRRIVAIRRLDPEKVGIFFPGEKKNVRRGTESLDFPGQSGIALRSPRSPGPVRHLGRGDSRIDADRVDRAEIGGREELGASASGARLDVEASVGSKRDPTMVPKGYTDGVGQWRFGGPEAGLVPGDHLTRCPKEHTGPVGPGGDVDRVIDFREPLPDLRELILEPVTEIGSAAEQYLPVAMEDEFELDVVRVPVARCDGAPRQHPTLVVTVTLHDFAGPQHPQVGIQTDQFPASLEVGQRRHAATVPADRQPAIGTKPGEAMQPDEIIDSLGEFEADQVLLSRCPRPQPPATLTQRGQGRRDLEGKRWFWWSRISIFGIHLHPQQRAVDIVPARPLAGKMGNVAGEVIVEQLVDLLMDTVPASVFVPPSVIPDRSGCFRSHSQQFSGMAHRLVRVRVPHQPETPGSSVGIEQTDLIR